MEAKQLIEHAITRYKVKLTCENAWPDKLQERTWARMAWDDAAEELELELNVDTKAIPLVRFPLRHDQF